MRRSAGLVALAGLFASPLAGCGPTGPTGEVGLSFEPIKVHAAAPAAPGSTSAPAAETPADAATARAAEPTGAAATGDAVTAAPQTPADLVAAHLAAGEFGAALRVAETITVPAERAALVQRVAEAQAAAGEFAAAGRLVGRFAEADRREAFGEKLTGSAPQLAGGGTGADFSELVNLITLTTAGPWFDIEGRGGQLAPYTAGVHVGPLGMMALLGKAEQSQRLRDLGLAARKADVGTDMATASDLRVVSLTRLERAVAERLAAGQDVPASMAHLAGLTRVQYVFLNEQTGEILVAGPAEGWKYDETGAAIGAESGRPTLMLDDLVTVLRTFSPGGLNAFQCLIVPRQEGLKAVQDYAAASNARGSLAAGAGVRNFVNRLEELLGEQDVVVNGVPVDSRVARVIVEADYRMKLIGVDKHEAAGLPSFFDLLTVEKGEAPVATKALRWWLTTNYEAVLHAADKTAFELVGPAVKCLSEDEFVTAQGERVPTGKAELTNKLFAERFTAGYEDLAAADRVFADLRNVMDLAMVAAVIRSENLDERAGWDRGAFAEGGAYRTATFAPASTVATVANHRVYKGHEVVVQVAGGVQADLLAVLKDPNLYRQAIRGLTADAAARPADLAEGRWWWDAK